MRYVCVSCHAILPSETLSHTAEVRCPSCSLLYRIEPNGGIAYDADNLLRSLDYRRWLLWKVLNNNGYLAYKWLQSSSISLAERPDVARFRKFIETNLRQGSLLDVGCGTLETPGYLCFDDVSKLTFYGLDPIGDSAFRWNKIVGCSEFMPFSANCLDTIVFATSLDHVCSLDATLHEVWRILKPEGRVFIWMSDRSGNFMNSLKQRSKNFIRRLIHRFPVDRFHEFENGAVFYTPTGAVDPFHIYYENPTAIIKQLTRLGLQLVRREAVARDEVFLCFEKASQIKQP